MAGLIVVSMAACTTDPSEDTDTVAGPNADAIRPFTIAVADSVLADLGDRDALNQPWLEMFPDENDRLARHTSKYDPPGGMKVQIEIVAVLDG